MKQKFILFSPWLLKSPGSLEAQMPTLIQSILDEKGLRLEMSGSDSRVLVTGSGLKDGDVICHCPCAFFSNLSCTERCL